MKLHIAGGCGEHGRNCFFVENVHCSFIVDCGLMSGAEYPFPRLTDSQIKAADLLFITHSHLDHTGAYTWLCEHGFSGLVVMTKETARQLPFIPTKLCLIDEMTPALVPVSLTQELSICWGKSGQCAGSVWYHIFSNDESILFSGDYIEETLIYHCDFLRGMKADIAVLDSAYGDSPETPAEYRDDLLLTVKKLTEQRKRIMFPVPKYGRGFELLLFIHRHFPQAVFWTDAHLQSELACIENIRDWIKPESLTELQSIKYFSEKSFSADILFLSDPQLKALENQKLTEDFINTGGKVLLTGYADIGSYSESLIQSGRSDVSRYAVHMSSTDMKALCAKNDFTKIVPFHM